MALENKKQSANFIAYRAFAISLLICVMPVLVNAEDNAAALDSDEPLDGKEQVKGNAPALSSAQGIDGQSLPDLSSSEVVFDPCSVRKGDEGKQPFWDSGYNRLSSKVCFPSRWVDRFFASPDSLASETAHTQVRLIYANRWQDDGDRGDDVRVRAKVELPNLQDRWQLIFRNDDTLSDESDELNRDPELVGAEGDNENEARAALRWFKKTTDRFQVSFDVGVRSELKTFVRGRYRDRQPIADSSWWFTFRETVIWQDPEGWSAESRFTFDRPINPSWSFRLDNLAELSEENNQDGRSWEWAQSVSFYQRLNKRSGIQYLLGWSGFRKPIMAQERVQWAIRFRRSIWRPWLYYEVEPFAFWQREDNFKGVTGVIGRLEVQLGRYD